MTYKFIHEKDVRCPKCRTTFHPHTLSYATCPVCKHQFNYGIKQVSCFVSPELYPEKQCAFDNAWAGQCKKEADASNFCLEHRGMTCGFCDRQAVSSCSFAGQLVCGRPLCERHKCQH